MQPAMPLFSVIIPVFNRESLIGQTLDSVLQQDLPPSEFEILCVDDGSSDRSLDVLRRYGGRIRVLQQENRGPGAARNLGISEAKGRYVAFLDSDDLWFPWALKTYQRVIEEQPAPSVIVAKWVNFHSPSELDSVQPTELDVKLFPDYLSTYEQMLCIGMSSFVIQTEWLRQVGGFTNENVNAEDIDLLLRLGTAPRFAQIKAPHTYGYRHHQISATRNLDRTYRGLRHMLQQERRGNYPGGSQRRRERLIIETRHVRPLSLDLLRDGKLAAAWFLYRRTLPWHVARMRWRYLLGFWARAALAAGKMMLGKPKPKEAATFAARPLEQHGIVN